MPCPATRGGGGGAGPAGKGAGGPKVTATALTPEPRPATVGTRESSGSDVAHGNPPLWMARWQRATAPRRREWRLNQSRAARPLGPYAPSVRKEERMFTQTGCPLSASGTQLCFNANPHNISMHGLHSCHDTIFLVRSTSKTFTAMGQGQFYDTPCLAPYSSN